MLDQHIPANTLFRREGNHGTTLRQAQNIGDPGKIGMLASEIVREKLFLFLHQELPYALTVEPELWERRDDGSIRAEITIYVERDNQKVIVLGKGGSMIKRIGQAARKEIDELLEERGHLFLFVKVRENWQEDVGRYAAWGLNFNA